MKNPLIITSDELFERASSLSIGNLDSLNIIKYLTEDFIDFKVELLMGDAMPYLKRQIRPILEDHTSEMLTIREYYFTGLDIIQNQMFSKPSNKLELSPKIIQLSENSKLGGDMVEMINVLFYRASILILWRDKWKVILGGGRSEGDIEIEKLYEEGILDEDIEMMVKQKVVLLNELGILDFLKEKKPFNTSTHALSRVIAKILNSGRTTISPYVSDLINGNTESKNHPYNSEESVEKVKEYLIGLGYY